MIMPRKLRGGGPWVRGFPARSQKIGVYLNLNSIHCICALKYIRAFKSEHGLAGHSDACFIPSTWEVETGASSIQVLGHITNSLPIWAIVWNLRKQMSR